MKHLSEALLTALQDLEPPEPYAPTCPNCERDESRSLDEEWFECEVCGLEFHEDEAIWEWEAA